jgi:hypothetical protein
MIRIDGELAFLSLCYMLMPTLLAHMNRTLSTLIDTNPGFFATDRTYHDLLPPSSFFPAPEGLDPFPLSSRESVT